ncbi:hypothetical protein CHARACLAT_003111 [Characodon lateralis]|uniref:Uncharacterized protein n=1 Tax=Characodon lateralis TaxID=208331 RepID=A0ABU7EG78_9TELE|nr:hypothetical protein [Characodon lateralis]
MGFKPFASPHKKCTRGDFQECLPPLSLSVAQVLHGAGTAIFTGPDQRPCSERQWAVIWFVRLTDRGRFWVHSGSPERKGPGTLEQLECFLSVFSAEKCGFSRPL